MQDHAILQDHAIDIAKAVPPVTVSAFTLFGFPLQNWVLILTAIYTCLQIYVLIRDKLINQKAINEGVGCNA